MLDAALEVHVLNGARDFDQNARKVRLDALRADLTDNRTHLVEHEIDAYLDRHSLTAPEGSAERATLAKRIMRAEIEALQRTLERDRGDYGGKPVDPIVTPPSAAPETLEPVPVKKLFKDYIASRQALGKHKDGAKAWETAILHLVKFLGHSDARRITKRNLLDWRDKLVAEKKSTKTIADKYLASVRAMLRWAHENDHLPTNEAEAVRQEVAKKRRTREAGYTDAEAIAVLKVSTGYQPKSTDNPAHRESTHIVSAKRWVPILCAFTGARVSEMTQLRKEDLRQEGDRWVIRITPDAGSVKTGDFRDVPLHQQVIALGFADFVQSARPGPLFHAGKTPARFLASARGTSGRISQWLHELELVPEGIQPSHAWRHRFKTQARDIGADTGDASELKALAVNAPSTGGILAPDSTSTTILEKVVEMSPIRQLATVIQMSGSSLKVPRLVDRVEPQIVAETGSKPDDEPSFEEITLEPFLAGVSVPMTLSLLEDSHVNLDSFVTGHIAKQFALKESQWFVNGNGTTAPEGVMSASAGIEELDDAATMVQPNDLVRMFYELPQEHAANGAWLMNPKTMSCSPEIGQ